jgi:hypothetical protein
MKNLSMTVKRNDQKNIFFLNQELIEVFLEKKNTFKFSRN